MIKLFPENLLFTKSLLCICEAVEAMDKKVAVSVEGSDRIK